MSLIFVNFFGYLREIFPRDLLRHPAGIISVITLPISIGLWIYSYRILNKASLEHKKETYKSRNSAVNQVTKEEIPISPAATFDIDLSDAIPSRPSSLLINYARQQLPKGDQPIRILVSSVKDCTHMCVQLANLQQREALVSLVDELTRFYQTQDDKLGKHPPTHLRVGDFVAAFFPEDNSWQRAEVRELDLHYIESGDVAPTVLDVDMSTADVDYCDYGDNCRLPLRYLRLLSDAGESVVEHFLRLPFQAIPMQLAGVKSKRPDGGWDEDAIEYFEKISSDELMAYSLDSCAEDGGILADVYNPNAMQPQEKSLAAELVRMGYAEWLV